MNTISFTPMGDVARLVIPHPVPAYSTIPEWYKNTPLTMDGKQLGIGSDNPVDSNGTIKACTPFIDAMTAGYMAVLAADIEVRQGPNDSSPTIRWRVEGQLMDWHTNKQSATLPRRSENYYEIFKWLFDWQIKTPKGYSCLYTHPINRNDLPFRTMTGIVDTDKYPESVHFPFTLQKNTQEITIIEKGTPICQIIPFKRDEWKSEINEFDPDLKKKTTFALMSKISRSYKHQFWSKKKFL